MTVAQMPRSGVRRDQHPIGLKDDVTPVAKRRSLPADQRNGTAKQPAVTRNYAGIVDAEVADDFLERRTDDLEDDEIEVPSTNPARGKINPLRTYRSLTNVQPKKQRIPLSWWAKLIIALIVLALVIWAVVTVILMVVDFGTDMSNTFNYGPNRTSIVSGVFGHHNDAATPTSVIAMNVKGALLIEEVPGGDVSKTKVYPTGLTLVGSNAAQMPIILTIKDLNQDHKPDVLVEIPGQKVQLQLMNNGKDFTLTR